MSSIRPVAGILIVLFAVVAIFGYLASCPLPRTSGPVVVSVEPGMTTREVGELLARNRVIRSAALFRFLVVLTGADGKLQSGEYSFEPGIFVWDAISSLVQGRVLYYTLTVREGLSVEEIADLVEERGFGSKDKFLELARDPSLCPAFVLPEEAARVKYPLEGYLFPDTYYVRRGMSEREIVSMMLKRFSQVYSKDLQDKARSLGLTPHQAATLASIIEKEAAAPQERAMIAAVYLNRLRIGMKLDADPTVMYALGKTAGSPLLKDLEVDSPYNTYRYPGLPPGPISNFGKASLEAALNPAPVDYLYFVSRNDGTHAFARTFSEHQQNVLKYQGR